MAYGQVAELVHQGARLLVGILFGGAAVVALTHWAVRARHLNPFGAWPRTVRRLSDPLLRPIEQRLARAGGNPQDATLWLLAGTVLGGLVLIGLVDWILGAIGNLLFVVAHPQGNLLRPVVDLAFTVVNAALLVRFIASWLPVSPHARWLRPVHRLTDWLLVPIRRILPTMGPFDFSIMAALLLLSFLRPLVTGALR